MTPTDGDRTSSAPRLLSRSADPVPLPPPVHDSEEVTSLHVKWAQLVGGRTGALHQAGVPAPGAAPGGATSAGGVGAKLRARVAAAAGTQSAADRALIGDLIRAVDTLATRVDVVAERVGSLELLLQEIVDKVSEDLVRVQVSLGALGPQGAPADAGAAER